MVGRKTELWNKLIREVQQKRVAGPFSKVPFNNYIQSPIGLVPKVGTGKTRLIFHLSYDFGPEPHQWSLNKHMPKKSCQVSYRDLDFAIAAYLCMIELAKREGGNVVIFSGKTDIQSAFRILGLARRCWPQLVMKIVSPFTHEVVYFVDKCLPFRASISCALFQEFSDALQHLIEFRERLIKNTVTNYLDDFLFLAYLKSRCNEIITSFIAMCKEIGIPIAEEKTSWPDICTVFLGILPNGQWFTLAVPLKKKDRAIFLLKSFVERRKVQVKDLQMLCGYLNFLCRAIHPGRVFTRCMYAKYSHVIDTKTIWTNSGKPGLKKHHHVRLDKEFRFDCRVWLSFLESERQFNRPMIDLQAFQTSHEISFFSDASATKSLDFGAILVECWIYGQWEPGFIETCKPSIEFLELFALTAGILTWAHLLKDCRIIIFCDNMAVVHMVNNITLSCDKCMILLRLLVLSGLQYNRRICVKYVRSQDNSLSDALSRLDLNRFRRLGPKMNSFADKVSPEVWPLSNLWNNAINFINNL